MRRAIALLVLFATGCSREAAPGPNQASPMEPEGPDPVGAAACAGQAGCRVESELLLSRDPDGRERLAVVARMAPHEVSHADHRIVDQAVNLGGPNLCTPFETSLVSRSGRSAVRSQSLVTDCLFDRNPAPPVVERVAEGVIRYRLSSRLQSTNPISHPPPMYGASEVTDFALDPPRILRTSHRDYGEGGNPYEMETTWDWEAFRGQQCWPDEGVCGPLLPNIAIPGGGTATGGIDAFAAGGWKGTSLGDCALRLEGSTSSLRLVTMNGDAFVEVTDDHFVTKGALVDALDVEVVPEGMMPGDHRHHERLTMDGHFIDYSGRTRQVEVVEVSPTTRRFAVLGGWLPGFQQWSFAYVDTDDGRTVAERVAPPSPGEHGQQVLWWGDWRATCAVVDGSLEPTHAPAPRSADE